MISAKVRLNNKAVNDEGYVSLSFSANYADDQGNPINQDWAYATPHMSVSATVRSEVGERFEQGKSYTLHFEEE